VVGGRRGGAGATLDYRVACDEHLSKRKPVVITDTEKRSGGGTLPTWLGNADL